jgi:Na+/proline symporter
MGGAVYALAVVITALIPLPEGHLLADPSTGYLSVNIASLTICVMVIIITFGGGLWAVLITDALQFIILTASVLIVVPLIVMEVGGPTEMLRTAPPGFLNLVNGEFTWIFLVGWGVVFFFKIGGEWAYVQRFVCVPTSKDAKKSTYLFGILYIISPIIWMLPPMAYRWVDPNADYEQAYILASQAVLPAGLLGLMIAAMCSATASMATTQLNVFAGAFTTEIYQRLINPNAPERELVKVGRIITIFLGGIIIAGALLIPILGTYTGYILASVAILTGPLVLPTIWGLFSRKIGIKTAWAVSIISIIIGLTVKLGFEHGGWLAEQEILSTITLAIQANIRVTDIFVGTAFPLFMLIIAEITIKRPSEGWVKIVANRNRYSEKMEIIPSTFPARLCAWSTISVGIMIGIISLINPENMLLVGGFGVGLILAGAIVLLIVGSDKKGPFPEVETAVTDSQKFEYGET